MAAVDLTPPDYMRNSARRGIELHEDGKSGDGVVPQTIEDARKMAAGTVTEEKWRKIGPWIARHLSDLDNVKDGEITAGVVAHLLWGSNGTKSGAIKTMNYAENIARRLEERADPPAPATDKIVGSKVNPSGSAKDKTGNITINEQTEKALSNKVKVHNDAMKSANKPAWTLTTLGSLKAVYRRGAGAFSTSHRPGIGRAQWAMARVNAFLVLCRTGKPNNPKYLSDNDLLNKSHPKYSGVRMYGNMNDQDERALPDNYRPANSDDVPAGAMCGTCISRNDEGMCMRFDAMCEADMYCNSYDPKIEEAMHEGYMHNDNNDLEVCVEATVTIPASWVVAQQGNRSVVYSNMELRAMAEGNTLVGYAAVWDSPSEPLPWTEFVRRGAFTKTIKDGADVRLLIDHEGVPLARSKSGTLRMQEDDFGLRIEAMLDENNPDAAKVMSALRRGDVSQMSFAFQTVKDSWSTDKRTRELKEVRLYDVSVVTYPAYEQTVAELRSRNNTPTDTVSPVAPLALRKRQIQLQRMQAEN